MKKKRILPIGMQDFEKLRKGGYVYVDKTAMIYELATKVCPYFLSLPERETIIPVKWVSSDEKLNQLALVPEKTVLQYADI